MGGGRPSLRDDGRAAGREVRDGGREEPTLGRDPARPAVEGLRRRREEALDQIANVLTLGDVREIIDLLRIEPLQEVRGVAADPDVRLRILLDLVAEAAGIDGDVVRVGHRGQPAAVAPLLRPQRRLRYPVLPLVDPLQVLQAQGVRSEVAEPALHDDVHVCSDLSSMEQGVPLAEELVGEGVVGQAVHGDAGDLAELREEGVDPQLVQGELVLQLRVQLLGQQLNEPDVLHRLAFLHRLPHVLQVLLDADGELLLHFVLVQIPSKLPEQL
mmetsp:Transcript_99517/g.267396  ORF Transcript_99517/g.267396 Transcript_99517/m.267396 type:complete len:271 (+) Transcript_99517:219-1031(+)